MLGVDLGQAGDPAAAAMLVRKTYDDAFIGPRYPRLMCRTLREWPLGTDYCQLVSDLLDAPVDVMVVEFNGVGRPVVDMLRREAARRNVEMKIRPVVTAQSNARVKLKTEARGSHWFVPKVDIVTSIVTLVQQRMLVFPDIPEVKTLRQEMADFQMRYSRSANLQFGNVPGAGKHDDLVIALGLACWWMQRFGARRFSVVC